MKNIILLHPVSLIGIKKYLNKEENNIILFENDILGNNVIRDGHHKFVAKILKELNVNNINVFQSKDYNFNFDIGKYENFLNKNISFKKEGKIKFKEYPFVEKICKNFNLMPDYSFSIYYPILHYKNEIDFENDNIFIYKDVIKLAKFKKIMKDFIIIDNDNTVDIEIEDFEIFFNNLMKIIACENINKIIFCEYAYINFTNPAEYIEIDLNNKRIKKYDTYRTYCKVNELNDAILKKVLKKAFEMIEKNKRKVFIDVIKKEIYIK